MCVYVYVCMYIHKSITYTLLYHHGIWYMSLTTGIFISHSVSQWITITSYEESMNVNICTFYLFLAPKTFKGFSYLGVERQILEHMFIHM